MDLQKNPVFSAHSFGKAVVSYACKYRLGHHIDRSTRSLSSLDWLGSKKVKEESIDWPDHLFSQKLVAQVSLRGLRNSTKCERLRSNTRLRNHLK